MEGQRCSSQWKKCSPQFSRISGQAAQDSGGAQGPLKNVTVVPTSRLLTEHQYKVRRPLFTAQHTSILKKTPVEHSTPTRPREVQPLPRTEPPLTPQAGFGEEHPLTCSEPPLNLRTKPREEQPPPHTEPPLSAFRSRTPPSSVLQVHRLNTPVRSPLSSPVLHPTYTPLLNHRRSQTSPKPNTRSQYQAEYWACAIPEDPPPTPCGRDPHRDYEALLDYTYPLRPGRDRPQPTHLNPTDWTLQDSGIEVDHLSTVPSELTLSLSGMEQTKGQRSPDWMESHCTPPSPTERRLTLDSGEWSEQRMSAVFPSSAMLIVLPQDKGHQSEQEDEEFRPLPESIEQLQILTQQVREAVANLDSTHWDPRLCPSVVQDSPDITNAKAHLRTEGAVESHRGPDQHSSLMEHINVFCCHLEQLIRWLYSASQKIERLAPPTVDIHSVKSSLAQYQSFQRDVNSHMPLTSSVLQTGHLLLSCIHSTSPVLRDTLLLIESQSRLLEKHTEHFFSSILSAMDSLTQPLPQTPSQSASDLHRRPQTGFELAEESRALSEAGEHGSVEGQAGRH